MVEVTSLSVFRFLKRLSKTRQEADNLCKITTEAGVKLKDVNEQLRRNVESQRILNKHLAASNMARRPKATVLQFPNK